MKKKKRTYFDTAQKQAKGKKNPKDKEGKEIGFSSWEFRMRFFSFLSIKFMNKCSFQSFSARI